MGRELNIHHVLGHLDHHLIIYIDFVYTKIFLPYITKLITNMCFGRRIIEDIIECIIDDIHLLKLSTFLLITKVV